MHVIVKDELCKTAMMALPPFGPGFEEADANRAQAMDVFASRFNPAGEDYVVFKLKDKHGKVFKEQKVKGY